MDKKSTILLTVVAIATLLVAVVGATFAYFAGTVYNDNSVNLTTTTAKANSVFNTMGSEITIDVTAADMQRGVAGTVSKTGTGTLTVSYLSGSEDETHCTYDILYDYATDSGEYTISALDTPSEDPVLEFTYAVTGTDEESTSLLSVAETNFVATEDESLPVTLNGNTKITIANNSDETPTVHTYSVTAKFYNIVGDQTANADKTFKIRFYAGNVVC